MALIFIGELSLFKASRCAKYQRVRINPPGRKENKSKSMTGIVHK
jgi:hypothetical protein